MSAGVNWTKLIPSGCTLTSGVVWLQRSSLVVHTSRDSSRMRTHRAVLKGVWNVTEPVSASYCTFTGRSRVRPRNTVDIKLHYKYNHFLASTKLLHVKPEMDDCTRGTVFVSNQATRATQPGHPSMSTGRQNEYSLWLQQPLEKNGELCVTVESFTRTASIQNQSVKGADR